MDHPNILPWLGCVIDPEFVTLVLEFAEQGDLFGYSKEHCSTIKDRVLLFHKVYPSILSAVSYLESLQIAHRDIKPENILIKTLPGEGIQPQLCDFGWSVFYLKAGARQTTLCGTPEYVPPEMLAEDSATKRRYSAEYVDSWAMGVLALEILQGETPFGAPSSCEKSDERRSAIYAKIMNFGAMDASLCDSLNQFVATTSSAGSGSIVFGCGPVTRRGTKRGRDCTHVAMVKDFLQPTPTHRLSATDCLKRYSPSLFGPRSSPLPPQPSVKQRLQIFQNSQTGVKCLFM